MKTYESEAAQEVVQAQFDPYGRLLAHLTENGELLVHDGRSGAVQGRLQAASAVAAFAWTQDAGSEHEQAGLVAVDSKQCVHLWRPASQEHAWSTPEAVTGSIVAVAVQQDTATIVAANGRATCLSLDNGAVQQRSTLPCEAIHFCAGLDASGKVLLDGGTGTVVIDALARTLQATVSGHATHVRAACMVPSGAYVATSAHSDPTVAFFKLGRKRSGTKARSAKGTMQMAAPPTSLACLALAADKAGNAQFLLLAVTAAGTAEVWRCSQGAKAVSGARACTVKCAHGEDSNAAQEIFAACFDGPHAIRVARGVPARPAIETVALESDAGGHVELPHVKPALLLQPSADADRRPAKRSAATALGHDNSGEAVLSRQLDGDAGGAEAAPALTDEDFQRITDDIPLSERLAALHEHNALAPHAPDDGAAHPGLELDGPITADSLVMMLSQALQAQDKVLLEQVLSAGRSSVIANTVRGLPAHEAGSLFKALVDRLQSTPARAAMLLPWLRATLLAHSSYLAAAPGLQVHMATVQRLAEARTAMLQPLIALSGRLDFVLAQHRPDVSASSPVPLAVVDASTAKAKPLAEILAGDDADSDLDEFEAEDPFAAEADGQDTSEEASDLEFDDSDLDLDV